MSGKLNVKTRPVRYKNSLLATRHSQLYQRYSKQVIILFFNEKNDPKTKKDLKYNFPSSKNMIIF